MKTAKITTTNDPAPKNFMVREDDSLRDVVQDLGFGSGVDVYLNDRYTRDLDTEIADGDSIEVCKQKTASGARA